MPRGEVAHDLADPETGVQQAVLDIAWPNGLQEGLSQPVALLLNEPPEVLELASSNGFRCFTSVESFKHYAYSEILGDSEREIVA